MALNKQQVPINLISGIDTKTDDLQVVAGKLLELENGVLTKQGSIQKRFGYDILQSKVLGTDEDITSSKGISSFKNELILFDGSRLLSYVPASEKWRIKGSANSVDLSNRSIFRDTYQQTNVDYAYNSGLGCYVWQDSSGGCKYSIIDESTGAIITSGGLLNGSAQTPRVIGTGRYFFIYYVDNVSIKFRSIQLTTPSTISSETTLTTQLDTTKKIYDVHNVNGRAYIAFNTNNPSGSIGIFYMNSAQSVSSIEELDAENCDSAVAIAADENLNIYVAFHDGTDLKYAAWTYALDVDGSSDPTVVFPAVTIETLADVRNIAGINTSAGTITWLYEVDNTAPSGDANFIRKNTSTVGGAVGTPAGFLRSMGLASKFFTHNSTHYITTAFQSTLQSTYFVYNLSGNLITKINQNNGGGYTAASILPTPQEVGSGQFIIPNQKKGKLLVEDGALFTALGVNSSKIDFNSLNNFVTADLGNAMHIVGGVLQSYDGSSISESGFAVFPEGVTAAETNVGAGAIANGTYNYVAVYAWTDNSGQIHRSAPSTLLQIAVAAGPSDVQVSVPSLRISNKSGVYIEIYRTENLGTIYYKVTSNTSLLLNNPAVDTINFTDTTPDASLLSGELLYTTSGELDNIAPPASSVIATYKNRVILKSSDEENVLWFSKARQEGKPVEFSDILRIVVDSKGGDISALGVLDDKLIIFKQDRLFLQAGDGPNNLGEQSDFGTPQLITADVGCVDVNSVVETPVGLMFKSAKGIYLLNRGLAVSYIGSEVEKFNSSRITSARLVPDSNQVRFTTEDNLALVYDYFYQQWFTFTNHEATGATSYLSKYCFVKSTGKVFVQNNSKYTDGAQAVKMKLVTSWLQFADIQGLQRIYKILLLGKYVSKHRLRIKLGYDFNPAFTQEVTIDTTAKLNPTAYGNSSPYGSETYYGGKNPLYQWRIFPKIQKCQSIRMSIEDVMDDVFGASFSINNFRLEVGIKQGSNKLGSNNSFKTT